MTVQTTKNSIQHTSLADQTDFVYDFIVLEEDQMFVSVDNIEYTQPFTVDGIGSNNGGTVFLSTPQAEGAKVVLYRFIEATQEIDYKKYDAFPAETHERGLDKLTLLSQQLSSFSVGAIRFPLAEVFGPNSILPPIETRALKFLFFDPDGGVSVSEGTSVGGEGVKSVSIHPDSINLLNVDNADAQNPLIQVLAPNTPLRLVTLDASGRLPEELLPGTLIKGIDVTADSVDLMKTDNVLDPTRPQVGAKQPINAPLSLIQLDASGQIPYELINIAGLRNLGLFRCDDLCDKAGDSLGECIVPDHRNPTERFPEATDAYRGGDYFIFTAIDPETDGTVNLFTEAYQLVEIPVLCEPGDGCIYFEEFRDDQNDLVLTEGWYYISDVISATSAEFVAYDPTGHLIVTPADINVQLAVQRLDANVLDRQVGGIVSGPISLFTPPTIDDHLTNKLYVDTADALVVADLAVLEARVTVNEADIATNAADILLKIEADDYAQETIGGTVKIRLAGTDAFFSTTINNP